MKNKDLYIAIGDIDEKFVEEAAKAAEKHRLKMRAAALRIGTAAACVALAAVAVPLALSLRGETTELPAGETHGSAADTRTDETDNLNAPVVDSPGDSNAPDTAAPEPEFVIENGVLWNYNGDDTDVVIPDEVIEVAETAFENSPQVESVTLGKNTEYVAPGTFLCLMALKNVYVPEENKSYETAGGTTIINKEELPNFESVNPYSERLPDYDRNIHYNYAYENYIEELKAKNIRIDRIVKFTVGDAVFEAELTPGSEENDVALKAITVYGRRVDLDLIRENYQCDFRCGVSDNFTFQAFWVDDIFVVSSLYYVGTGVRLLVTKDGLFICTDRVRNEDGFESLPETRLLFPNSYSTFFFYEKDGVLHYERTPIKFISQAAGGRIIFCVGRDEIYCETGRVIIEDGTVKTIAETKVTVDEALDLEQEYKNWVQNVGGQVDIDMEKISLDEFLARNGPDAPWASVWGFDPNLYQKEE